MICPEGAEEDVVNGGVRFVPGVVMAVVFGHEVNQTSRQNFNPLSTEFYVEFVLLPKDPFVALDVYRRDRRMMTHLREREREREREGGGGGGGGGGR